MSAPHKSQALSSRQNAPEDARQQMTKPRTALDVMREANRAKAQQQEAQRKAWLNVKDRPNTRGDQWAPQPKDLRTRDDDRER